MSKASPASIYSKAIIRRVRNGELLLCLALATCFAISSFHSLKHMRHLTYDNIYNFDNNAAESQFEHPERTVHPRVFLFAGESTAAPRIIKYGEDEENFSPRRLLSENQQENQEQCIFRPWQTASHSNCNEVHTFLSEESLIYYLKQKSRERQKRCFTGGHRIAFLWPREGDYFIYKTTLFEEEYDFKTYEKSRREVATMEMLDASIGIYGHCGMTSLTEYADGHSLTKVTKDTIAPLKKLEYAVKLTHAVAGAHSIDAEDGYASLIHGDLDGRNVFFVHGQMKMMDFDHAKFVPWNDNTRRPCFPTLLPSSHQSDTIPPERLREATIDEKVDIYQLGTLLFQILTGVRPYHCDRPRGICNKGVHYDNTLTEFEIKMLKSNGTLPVLPEEIEMSSHPATIAIREAMKRMLQQDPKRRPSAKEVAGEVDSLWKNLTLAERKRIRQSRPNRTI